jgi:signal peptidase I
MWSSKKLVRRWVEAVVLLLTAAIVLETWLVAGLVTPIVVQGESMLPTLAPERRILVNRAAFYFSRPRRWQLAVFRCPEDARVLCVKRIVGLPQETVEIRDGQLWIDGRVPNSSAQPDYEFAPIGQPAQYRLSDNEYFLLGDHPSDSIDSRTWQPPGISPKLFIGSPLWCGNWGGASTDRSDVSTSEPPVP